MNDKIKDLITPKVPVIAEYFGIPYRTALRWSQDDPTSWRKRMYVYLVDRYKKEMK